MNKYALVTNFGVVIAVETELSLKLDKNITLTDKGVDAIIEFFDKNSKVKDSKIVTDLRYAKKHYSDIEMRIVAYDKRVDDIAVNDVFIIEKDHVLEVKNGN